MIFGWAVHDLCRQRKITLRTTRTVAIHLDTTCFQAINDALPDPVTRRAAKMVGELCMQAFDIGLLWSLAGNAAVEKP